MHIWIGTSASVSKADVIAGTGATIEVGPLVVDGGIESTTIDLGPLSGGTDYYLHVAMDLTGSNVETIAFTMELEVSLITLRAPAFATNSSANVTTKTYDVDLSPYRAGDLVMIFSQIGWTPVQSCTVGGANAPEVQAVNLGNRAGALFQFTMTGAGAAVTEIVITVASATNLRGFDTVFVVPDGEVSASSVADSTTDNGTLSTSVTAPAIPNGILTIAYGERSGMTGLTVGPPTEIESAGPTNLCLISVGFVQDVTAGSYTSTVETTGISQARVIMSVALRAV